MGGGDWILIGLAATAGAAIAYALGGLLSARAARYETGRRLLHRAGVPEPMEALSERPSRTDWHSLGIAFAPRKEQELRRARERLSLAGLRQDWHLGAYYGLRHGGALLAVVAGLGLTLLDRLSLHTALVAAVAVLYLPDLALKAYTQHRRQRINAALPEFVELCNIAMGAGLNWMAAVQQVAEKTERLHPDLSREFLHMLDQARAGMSRSEALTELARRNPSPALEHLVQVLIQNERLGSGISDSLSGFAQRIYNEREQVLEEKANRLSAKMALVTLPFLLAPFAILLVGEQVVMLLRNLTE